MGRNTEGIADLRELLAAREMNYDVFTTPSFVHPWVDKANQEDPKGWKVPVSDEFHLRRDSDGKIVSTQTVSGKYSPLSPTNLVDEMEFFVQEGLATPEAAFTIKDGTYEYVALRIADKETKVLESQTGERYDLYLVGENIHGNGAARASLFGERVNGRSGMIAFGRSGGFKVIHRGNAVDTYKKGMERWSQLQQVIAGMADMLVKMMRTPITFAEAQQIFWKVLRVKPGEEPSGYKRNLHAEFMSAFHMPRYGTSGANAMDVYNAVTFVNTHYTAARSKLTAEDITEQILAGSRGKRELRVLELLAPYVAK
jgi:hypothetical protein